MCLWLLVLAVGLWRVPVVSSSGCGVMACACDC